MFEFSETRSGKNMREFVRPWTPQAWLGALVTDRFSGYNDTTTLGETLAQHMAYARGKFNDLWITHGSEFGLKAMRHHVCGQSTPSLSPQL